VTAGATEIGRAAPENAPPRPPPPAPPPPRPPSSPIDPDAAAALAGLGLPLAAASRLLRKAFKLKAGPHGRDDGGSSGGSGGRGGGSPLASSDWSSSDEGGGGGGSGAPARAQAPGGGLPDRASVEAAAAALLATGLRVADLAGALERAPGLLALPPALLAGRAGALRSRWGLSAAATASLVRFRPALLCSRGARRRLTATLSALTAPRLEEEEEGEEEGEEGEEGRDGEAEVEGPRPQTSSPGAGGAPPPPPPPPLVGLNARQLGALIERCPAALWVPPPQVDAAWGALVREVARVRGGGDHPGLQAAVAASATLMARHPTELLLRGGWSHDGGGAARVEGELVGAGVPAAAAAAAAAGAGPRALAAATPGHAAAVADGLRASGLDEATVAAALAAAPAALLGAPSAREVELKARLATDTLGAPPAALGHGPAARGLFRRDVGATVGPRFAFVRELLAERGGGGGGGSMSRKAAAADEAAVAAAVVAPPPPTPALPPQSGRLLTKGRRAAVGTVGVAPVVVDTAAAARQQQQQLQLQPGKPLTQRPGWGFPIDAPSPATPLAAGRRIAAILRGDDAVFASTWAGVPPSEYAVFKRRWQAEVLPSLGLRVAPGGAAGRRRRAAALGLGGRILVPRPRRRPGRPGREEADGLEVVATPPVE